ncbi:thiaminase II [Alteribacter natronophilus]|uniref:thiaminase II n=1 Tax=Alteribacter natronophilus TaxID=2583810 RepID=UPI00110D3A02|nr:thiaminase II [Alteribacter natronophilus]TMW70332.1 thiaminase II [Alteribacter natronophilus]
MSFSQKLRQEAAHIFEAVYRHPFVQEIGKGTLGKDQLIHYVKQDFEYLNAYIHTRGLAISKCTERKDMAMFSEGIEFILNSEIHPHNNFCRVAEVDYEELQGYALAPTAQHYTRHMLNVAQNGTLAEIIAVSLPCPWIYMDIGERLMQDFTPDDHHPFNEWIRFYGEGTRDHMQPYLDRLDELAEHASEGERTRMKEHFMLSCQLEYMFFDMAYTLQDWPVKKEASVSN